MKKKFLSAATGLALTLNLSAQLLCGTYSDFDSRVNNVGAFHNAMLDHMNQIALPSTFTTRAEGIEYIKNELIAFYTQNETGYFPQSSPPEIIRGNFDEAKNFLQTEDFVLGLRTPGSGISIQDCISMAENSNLMDTENLQILRDISDEIVNSNSATSLSAESITRVEQIANRWLTLNEGRQNNGKELTGAILGIALKSIEWWQGYNDVARTNNMSNNFANSGPCNDEQIIDTPLLLWPFLDLAGALVGGVLNGTAEGALAGGALASIGAVGRIARWFQSWFH